MSSSESLFRQFTAEIERMRKELEAQRELAAVQERVHKRQACDSEWLWARLAEAEGGEARLREHKVRCQFHDGGKMCDALATEVLSRPFIFVCPAHKEEWTRKVEEALEEQRGGKRRKEDLHEVCPK